MTVYSQFNKKRQLALAFESSGVKPTEQPALPHSGRQVINIILLACSVLLVFVYIFLTNQVVAQKFSIETLKAQLDEVNVSLELKRDEIENEHSLESLASFARGAGLVEATETDSVFAESGVALSQVKN